MTDADQPKTVSDRSDRSDPFGIVRLFQSDLSAEESDPSDKRAVPRPTCPTLATGCRTEIMPQEQASPTCPTCPASKEDRELTTPSADLGFLLALDDYEDRAAIREHLGKQPREEAEAAALVEAARAAGVTPTVLTSLWASHPDARPYLEHLKLHGPSTAGEAGSGLGWAGKRPALIRPKRYF